MRISDWSSDVCSSDLEVERLCEIDVARLVIRRRGVRDVRREHHHALAAQLERRRMQAKEFLGCHHPVPSIAALRRRAFHAGPGQLARTRGNTPGHDAMAVPKVFYLYH